MLGLLYHHATLLPLILIVTYSAHIFTNAILKNMKKMKKMKVYISGKIGEEVISEATRQKFEKAGKMLLEKGYEVVDPACEKYQREMEEELGEKERNWIAAGMGKRFDRYSSILLFDLHILEQCDAVYFIDDWHWSGGARTEHSFALATGKKLLWEFQEDAEMLRDSDNEELEDVWLPIEE